MRGDTIAPVTITETDEMTSDSANAPKRKPVCVIHTGAEEVFTYRRLVDYGQTKECRYAFSEILDLGLSETGVGSEEQRAALADRVSHEEYILLLAGENTSKLSGVGRQALMLALYMRRPIIVVNLDGGRHCDPSRLPGELDGRLILCISSELPVLEFALDSWRDESFRLSSMGQTHAAVYPNDLYETLIPVSDSPHEDGVSKRIAL